MLLYVSKCMLAIYDVLTDAVCSTYQPQLLTYMQQCKAIGTKQCVHHMQGFAFLCVHLKSTMANHYKHACK